MPPEKIKNGWLWPIIGSLAVLVVSPLAVWITGKNYYALVLLPLILFLWVATRLKKDEIGKLY